MVCKYLFKNNIKENIKENIIIFDTSWVAHASASAKAYNWMAYEGKFTGHIVGTMSKILSALKYFGNNSILYTDLIFVYDRYPTKVYEIYPEYKAGRVKTFDPIVDVENMVCLFSNKQAYPEYKAGRVKTFDPIVDVENMVCLFSNKQAYADETEADHVIASIAAKHCYNQNVYIISADKDLWQLLEYPNICITPRYNEMSSKEKFYKKFGINNPNGLALHKAIFGDVSDNIPKLKGTLQHKPIKNIIDKSDGTPDNFFYLLENLYENDMRKSVYDILLSNKEYVKKMYSITKLNTCIDYKIEDKSVSIKELECLRNFLHSFGVYKFDNEIIKLFTKDNDTKPKLNLW